MNTEQILLTCVAKHDPREYLQSIIREGDYLNATDGRIALRMPFEEGVKHIESGPQHPKFDELFERNRRDTFIETPALPELVKCRYCNGTAKAYKCTECDGAGEFQHGRHYYDCKECGASGQVYSENILEEEPQVVCGQCKDGFRHFQPMQIGATHYDAVLIKRVVDLPGFKFSPPPTTEYEHGAGYFVFDGGEGIILPVRT
jgi:hypothetical protein